MRVTFAGRTSHELIDPVLRQVAIESIFNGHVDVTSEWDFSILN